MCIPEEPVGSVSVPSVGSVELKSMRRASPRTEPGAERMAPPDVYRLPPMEVSPLSVMGWPRTEPPGAELMPLAMTLPPEKVTGWAARVAESTMEPSVIWMGWPL